jgi:hypothetical protein
VALDVVLIHLGSRVPGFVRTAAAQAQAVSGRDPIVIGPLAGARLAGSRLDRFRERERLSDLGLTGFWRYSAERLFVLEEAMREAGIERCLHIESDNLLYLDPAAYEGWLGDTYGDALATCPHTDDEDTAAIMYVGSRRALGAYLDALLELVEMGPEALLERHGGPMANEMRMLFLLRAERGLAQALPTTVAAGLAIGAPALFDPASYGQLVDGTPGAPGVPYAGNHQIPGREIVSGNYRVVWDAQQRIPTVESTSDSAALPLANLHIHSKRLSRWTTEVRPPEPPGPPGRAAQAAAYLYEARRRLRPIRRKISAKRRS